MRMHEHTLGVPFLAEGQFWLPDTPAERVSGTLSYSPGSITLNLIGDPGAVGTDGLLYGDGGMRELIVGSTRVGACALWNSFVTSANTTFGVGGRIAVATYRTNR